MKRPSAVIATMMFAPLVLLAPAVTATAQSRPIRLGVLGGVNLAKLSTSFDGIFEPDQRVGAVVGAQLFVPLSPALGLEIDGQYSMKGAKIAISGVSATGQLDYLELPVLLRLDIASNAESRVVPFVVVGPSVAMRTGCSLKGGAFGLSVSLGCARLESALTTKFKTFDFSGVVGGGLDFTAGTNRISLGARYTYGLIDIGNVGSVRNRAISLMAGYSIPLGK